MTLYDYKGHKVDHCITYSEFIDEWLTELCHCHDFNSHGFLYDEGGVWGLPDTPVGFKTEEDCIRYNKWLEVNKANNIKKFKVKTCTEEDTFSSPKIKKKKQEIRIQQSIKKKISNVPLYISLLVSLAGLICLWYAIVKAAIRA